MKSLKAIAIVFCLLVGSSLTAAPTLELVSPGITTKTTNIGQFDYKLKDPGKLKLHVTTPILEVWYKGKLVDKTGWIAKINGGAVDGWIQISNPKVPPGKATVKVKVKLTDNSTLEAEKEIDFQEVLEETSSPLDFYIIGATQIALGAQRRNNRRVFHFDCEL